MAPQHWEFDRQDYLRIGAGLLWGSAIIVADFLFFDGEFFAPLRLALQMASHVIEQLF